MSDNSPILRSLIVSIIAFGNLATIPAKMMRDIPLPIPRSVICSPSHIIKAVPEVKVIMVISLNDHPGVCTNAPSPMPSIPAAIPND